MSKAPKDVEMKLMDTEYKQEDEVPTPKDLTWNQFEYKQFGNQPKITLSGLPLLILCPILVCLHIRVAMFAEIPMIQMAFVGTLGAFLINYTLIIRKYELMPYLPEEIYDLKLKKICVAAVLGEVFAIVWGWNGSGGILFAMAWESIRGNKMGFYGYMLVIIIIGSILMEENFSYYKLLQFIPGVLFGYVDSTLFTLRESSVYAIAHQFLLLSAIVYPMLFPIFHVIVPSLWQWLIMIGSGITVLITTVLTIRLMQTQRVSVVMGVTCGLMMIGTSAFGSKIDFIGAGLILVGIVLLIKKQYIDLQF